jgi:hypothetical protein
LICFSVGGIAAKATLVTKCPSQEHISPTTPELNSPEQLAAVETSTIQPTTIDEQDAAMPFMPNVEITRQAPVASREKKATHDSKRSAPRRREVSPKSQRSSSQKNTKFRMYRPMTKVTNFPIKMDKIQKSVREESIVMLFFAF